MKLVVSLFLVLLGACATAGGTSTPAHTVMVVDGADRWTVAIDGDHVVLTPIGESTPKGLGPLGGDLISNVDGKRTFELKEGAFAGGRFVVLNDNNAELTLFGSGVPVISKQNGPLVGRGR